MESIALTAPNGVSLAASAHPWRRFFARTLDLTVYSVLWAAVQTLVLHWWMNQNPLTTIVQQYITLALMLLIEPVLLCTVGTTPGKWILGFRLRNANGDKLTYREAIKRTWTVFCEGFGYGIPIYNLVRMARCRRDSLDFGALDWEDNESYYLRDLHQGRYWCVVFANILCTAFLSVIVLQGNFPLHRGDLTPSQYAANCNELFNRTSGNTLVMDANGVIAQKSNPGEYAINVFEIELPRHELTVENGIVKGVRLYYRGDWPGEYAMQRQVSVAYVAFVGAQKKMDAVSLARLANSWAKEMRESSEGHEYGVRVKKEFKELENEQIEIVFTMEKE